MAIGGIIGILIQTWLMYLIPLILVGGPVWFFGRKKVAWNLWDFSVAVIPFWIWALLMF